MKKILTLLVAGSSLFLTSCETTREITINNDGTGTYVTTTDMSSLIGIAKMAGQGQDELKDLEERVMDTTVMLSSVVDHLKDLSDAERAIVSKGSLDFVMNVKDEKFFTKVSYPFTSTSELSIADKVTGKVVEEVTKSQMTKDGEGEESGAEEGAPSGLPGMDNMPKGSIDEYFVTTYSKNKIERKLDKEKYAKIAEDEGMTALKELSAMGMGNSTIIYNLPKAAKSVTGKNVTLSEDKKKVTITSSVEDFFDDGTSLEFSIEY